jgi:glycosyltransferase involved in cell wall biosynthesis
MSRHGDPTVQMKRFLVLTPAWDGADGISELSRQVVHTLVDEAGADGVEVWALDGAVPAGLYETSRPAFRSASRSRSRLLRWTLTRASTALDGLTVVVMHAHLSPIAEVLALRGARVAVFLIGIEVWRKLRARERYAIEHAHRLIAISRHTAERFRAANPDIPAREITICPPGIGAAPVERWQSADSGFALIVGRLWAQERYKGHDWLIDIWPAVRRAVPGARLIVVGAGDDRARLEARVAADNLDGGIRFLGRVHDDDLAGLYRASAFFVMPSTGEGFGLTYLEAMRAGKPCIAVHGAADEIIHDDVNGLLVQAGNSKALIDAVVRLFTDRDLRARMGAAAAASIAREFTADHFACRFRAALGLPPAFRLTGVGDHGGARA